MEGRQREPKRYALRDACWTCARMGSRGGVSIVVACAMQRLTLQHIQVEWKKGSAFDAATYESLLPSCDGLVTTLGALFESDYKKAGAARPLSVLRAIAENATGSRGNPLAAVKEKSYERLNRDSGGSPLSSDSGTLSLSGSQRPVSAIELYEAFRASRSGSVDSTPAPFVFISAEDIFRPFVPERYIRTKREAEHVIWTRTLEDAERPRVRPIFMRPSQFLPLLLLSRH